eukprot:SAG31_NODE_6600_length_1956_cov_1.208401_3_plen_158_part_00
MQTQSKGAPIPIAVYKTIGMSHDCKKTDCTPWLIGYSGRINATGITARKIFFSQKSAAACVSLSCTRPAASTRARTFSARPTWKDKLSLSHPQSNYEGASHPTTLSLWRKSHISAMNRMATVEKHTFPAPPPENTTNAITVIISEGRKIHLRTAVRK